MLSALSSNAVLSKARAMYGKRLTAENYRELLNCKTVGEIAAVLKSRTVYGKLLAGINENEIHRGMLETELKKNLFEDYASLARYEITVGENFARYLVTRSEIEQILHGILLLDAGTPEEYFFTLPTYLAHRTRINLAALGRSKSYEDILNALGRTPYRKLLEPFRPEESSPVDFTGIEIALYTYLGSCAYGIINDRTRGESARQLRDIFDAYADLTNYVNILRLKLHYHAHPDTVRKSLLPYGTLKKNVLEGMLDAKDGEEAEAIMRHTKNGKRALNLPHTYADEIPHRINFRLCRHYIRFSTHPSVVMVSYLFLMQAEITDIITIVEGIRYQLSPVEIEKLLVVYSDIKERGE